MDTPPTLTAEAEGGIAPDPAMPAQWGEYELLERLDAGAMGVMYKSRHTKLDRLAAIKVVCGHRVGDERIVASF